MADRFVELETVSRSREEQMLIYAACRLYKKMTDAERGYIRALISDIAGPWGRALFALLTTDASFDEVVNRFTVPEGKLRTMRREFYERCTFGREKA